MKKRMPHGLGHVVYLVAINSGSLIIYYVH